MFFTAVVSRPQLSHICSHFENGNELRPKRRRFLGTHATLANTGFRSPENTCFTRFCFPLGADLQPRTSRNEFQHSCLSFLPTSAINKTREVSVHLLCFRRTNWWEVHTFHPDRQIPSNIRGRGHGPLLTSLCQHFI